MSEEIVVRRLRLPDDATQENAAGIALLAAQLNPSDVPRSDVAWLWEMLSPATTHLLVAQADAAIVGMLTVCAFAVPNGWRAYIEDVAVDQAHRKRGIARRLFEEAFRIQEENGWRTLQLTSRPSREEANLMYPILGFTLARTNVYRRSPYPSTKYLP